MSLSKIFSIAGSAMSAQSTRLNVTASNLANAGSVGGSPRETYRAHQPVFASYSEGFGNDGIAGVRLIDIVQSTAPLKAGVNRMMPSWSRLLTDTWKLVRPERPRSRRSTNPSIRRQTRTATSTCPTSRSRRKW